MDPNSGEAAAGEGAAGLRPLVLMVREEQVGAAGMDVEAGSQIAPGHRAALDMPTRPPAAPGAVPARQIRAGGLPQHEIPGVALERGHVDPRAGQQLVRAAAGQAAVFGVAGDGEQHVPFRRVGVAGVDQPLDQRDHLGDVLGGARLHIRRDDVELGEVRVEIGQRAFGDRADGLSAGGGARVDLVVHVRDVPDIGDARIQVAQ